MSAQATNVPGSHNCSRRERYPSIKLQTSSRERCNAWCGPHDLGGGFYFNFTDRSLSLVSSTLTSSPHLMPLGTQGIFSYAEGSDESLRSLQQGVPLAREESGLKTQFGKLWRAVHVEGPRP